jgi:hypothetical protein
MPIVPSLRRNGYPLSLCCRFLHYAGLSFRTRTTINSRPPNIKVEQVMGLARSMVRNSKPVRDMHRPLTEQAIVIGWYRRRSIIPADGDLTPLERRVSAKFCDLLIPIINNDLLRKESLLSTVRRIVRRDDRESGEIRNCCCSFQPEHQDHIFW